MDGETAPVFFDRFVGNVLRPVAIAGSFVLVAFLWTLLLQHLVAYPFLFLFLGAVMGSAWFGGRIAGAISVVLSTAIIDFFFVPPFYSFYINNVAQTYCIAFIVCAITMSWVSSARKRNETAIKDARDQLEQRVLERTAELQLSNAEIRDSERRLRTLTEERHRAEQALVQAQAELSNLSHRLGMGELAASIAHELNQPLTAVVTNAYACREWLQASPPNLDRASSTAQRIVQESKRASDVVARVRALFRKDIDSRGSVDINRLIQDLVRLLHDDAIRRRISLHVELDETLPRVTVDPIQIQQVLLNLATNGIDAMTSQPTHRNLVIRSLSKGADEIQIQVIDCGAGIDPDVAPKIFEAFFTTKAEGIGMGLAICRTIIEAHDGRIWMSPEPSGGSCFHFTIPVRP
jgi:C4-dicarboxylate-specific signal transduction histidine kinase